MKLWRVYATVTGGKYLGKFKAASKEEAEQLALDKHSGPVNLCYQCAGECEDAEIQEVSAEEAE